MPSSFNADHQSAGVFNQRGLHARWLPPNRQHEQLTSTIEPIEPQAVDEALVDRLDRDDDATDGHQAAGPHDGRRAHNTDAETPRRASPPSLARSLIRATGSSSRAKPASCSTGSQPDDAAPLSSVKKKAALTGGLQYSEVQRSEVIVQAGADDVLLRLRRERLAEERHVA